MPEHVVKVKRQDTERLRQWLQRPNGALSLERVTFEAVEDGGILVRTLPWGWPEQA